MELHVAVRTKHLCIFDSVLLSQLRVLWPHDPSCENLNCDQHCHAGSAS